MKNSEVVFEEMNRLGKEKRPFLFAINFDLTEAFIIENPTSQQEILYQTPLGTNYSTEVKARKGVPLDLQAYPLSYGEYHRRFEVIRRGQLNGNSFLANLTVATAIDTPLSLKEIYTYSQAKYKLFVPRRFVSFSPESFVKIDFCRSCIETRPMKGTINANIPNALETILSDPKEKAEHYTIVDLMRSDLARVASDITVKRFRYVDRLATSKGGLLQVSSLITGKVSQNSMSRLGDIFRQLLPAGSISGAPKPATLHLIREAEKESRGFYSGIFGFFDGSIVDSGVLIRFIAENGKWKKYHSGGGITIHSDPKAEYKEVLEKIYIPT